MAREFGSWVLKAFLGTKGVNAIPVDSTTQYIGRTTLLVCFYLWNKTKSRRKMPEVFSDSPKSYSLLS
jgi:hypothetical protein